MNRMSNTTELPRLAKLQRAVPMLAVPDVNAAIAFYRDRLGFSFVGVNDDPPSYGIVERDGVAVHFIRSSGFPTARGAFEGSVDNSPGGMYIEVEDVDAVACDLERRGWRKYTPEDKHYGWRDFWLPDLHGYVVVFGQRREAIQEAPKMS